MLALCFWKKAVPKIPCNAKVDKREKGKSRRKRPDQREVTTHLNSTRTRAVIFEQETNVNARQLSYAYRELNRRFDEMNKQIPNRVSGVVSKRGEECDVPP